MNNTKSLIALSSGILGVAGIGLLSAGQAQAATTTATVNYADGATTVWTSPTTGQTAKRYIFKGQSVNLLASQKIGAETWYRIGNGEWVPERYLTTAEDTTAQATPAATTPAPAAQKTARIAYAGGATTVWSSATYTAPSGQYLTYGQNVTVTKTTTVAGEEWYQLENGGWVPARFTGAGKIDATPAQPTTEVKTEAPAVTTPAPKAEVTPAQPVVKESTPAQTTTTPTQQTQQPAAKTPAPQTNTTPAVTTPAPSTNHQTPATGNAQSVINLAMAQIGKPYAWGAKGPSSFDCSGLMHYIFANGAGREIGGWTVPQESAGRAVSLSSLQPGDLLFWGAQGSSYHVAIYIGGGQYIHAPKPGDNVKIGSMQYYAPSFARRVF